MQYKKIKGYLLDKSDEKVIEHILPEIYIDNDKKITTRFALKFLQNELNYQLSTFLNGGFTSKGFILYPLVKDVSKTSLNKMKRVNKIVEILNNQGYDFENSLKLLNKSYFYPYSFAKLLSTLYQDYEKINFFNKRKVVKNKCRVVSFKKDKEYTKPIVELKNYAEKNLKQYLSGFYLHGSFATKDYIKYFSDVDTVSIVSKKTIKNPKDLVKLRSKLYYMRKYFYKIDPLQHHGTIIISEFDLNNYCEAYFPTVLFKYCESFFADKKIEFRLRDYKSEALSSLFWFVSYFRKLNFEEKYNLNSYDLKTLIHSITLFPALYLATKSKLMYKKYSFSACKKDFKKLWGPVSDTEKIRKNWNKYSTVQLIKLISHVNPLLSYQLNFRINDLFNHIKKENDIDTKYLIDNMYKLSEFAWKKAKK